MVAARTLVEVIEPQSLPRRMFLSLSARNSSKGLLKCRMNLPFCPGSEDAAGSGLVMLGSEACLARRAYRLITHDLDQGINYRYSLLGA